MHMCCGLGGCSKRRDKGERERDTKMKAAAVTAKHEYLIVSSVLKIGICEVKVEIVWYVGWLASSLKGC